MTSADSNNSLQIREKEEKALEEKDAGVTEAKRRQKLIARLPSTFDMILLMFQSGSRSIMTKQELTHKIIANHCKIVDKGNAQSGIGVTIYCKVKLIFRS